MVTAERILTDEDIASVRDESFQAAKRCDGGYVVGRRFFEHQCPVGDSYLHHLPRLDGKDASDVIDEKIKDGLVYLFDGGCGNGQGMIDLVRVKGEAVRARGLSAVNYYSDSNRFDERWLTKKTLRWWGIEIDTNKDIQALGQHYLSNQYDIFLSVMTALHLADPWALIEGAHKILKVGGVAFIGNIKMYISYLENEALKDFLRRKYGMLYELSDKNRHHWLAFIKEREDLKTPLIRSEVVRYPSTPPVIAYRFAT